MPRETPLGVIVAGGRSVRFGSQKAFASVRGTRIVDRVRTALSGVAHEVVVVANDAPAFAVLDLPLRGDVVPGLGALGGIHTAVVWARECGHAAAIAVACDMPFVPGALLQEMWTRCSHSGADIVAAESDGPRGVEPLCAVYRTSCLDAIERAIAREDRRVVGFWPDVTVLRIAQDELHAFGDPATLFMNVNTREDLAHAESIAEHADV